MSVSQRDEAWRRKPKYTVEECYTLTPHGLSRGIRFILLSDGNALKDQHRILSGLVCANCMEPFPAKPGRDTLQLFIDSNIRYPRPDREWHDLVRQGHCPMCGDEVSYEYAALMDEGQLPVPEWMKGI